MSKSKKPILTPEEKKSAWEVVIGVIKTILTLGLNHLITYLQRRNR